MSEMVTTYNPWYHIFKYTYNLNKRLVYATYNKIQSVLPYKPDWQMVVALFEDSLSHVTHFIGPRIGVHTVKITPTECACDEPKIVQQQAKFSCEFHITQDDADAIEENEDEENDTATLMSVHLDTFLDKRYEWYSKTQAELPRGIRQLVLFLMDLLSVPFNTLMFLSKNANMWLQDMIKHAQA